MKFKKLTAAALAAAMLISVPATSHAKVWCYKPVSHGGGGGSSAAPWIIIGCAGGVVLAALAANYRDSRELTAAEAWSCGTLFLFSRPRNT